MKFDYLAAQQYITALTGSPDTVMDWRSFVDNDDSQPGWNYRGSLAQAWVELIKWQKLGRGVFVTVNETDGIGRKLPNITAVRAHFIDSDNVERFNSVRFTVANWSLKPHFEVWSSEGKAHIYWKVERYIPGAHFSDIQQRLRTIFGTDGNVADASRVLRVPGFYNLKTPSNPQLVRFFTSPGYENPPHSWSQFNEALAGIVPPVTTSSGTRTGLGDPALAAPSFEVAVQALMMINPSTLTFTEWIKVTAAFKQSTSTHTDDSTAFKAWSDWCASYEAVAEDGRALVNNPGENLKQWRYITDTSAGWPALKNKSGYFAVESFGSGPGALPPGASATRVAGGLSTSTALTAGAVPSVSVPTQPSTEEKFGVFLNEYEQARFFKGFTYVVSLDQILCPNGMFLGSGAFNNTYSGHQFKIKEEGNGASTDEAWKAATRGQHFQIPKVHFTRFLPDQPTDIPFVDEFGRKAVNMYRPANIIMREGDPAPFVNHIRKLLPTERDVHIFLAYLAHCVQRPGKKAKWAPLIQSTEGAGKGVIKETMIRCIGRSYVHSPNARELGEGGGKFNGWMEGKLLIVADEIRVDERRDMIEVLKPMITELTLEIQRKGVDQIIGDNVSNWIMFSNYKDAIPITLDSRRFAIFYSLLQSRADLIAAGMDADYFSKLFGWLEAEGYEIVAHYLKHYIIPHEFDPMGAAITAPETSSLAEALRESLGQYEQKIAEAIEEGRAGFRNGWVSSWAVATMLGGKLAPRTVAKAIQNLGFGSRGRVTGIIPQEGGTKPTVYHKDDTKHPDQFTKDQGY